MSKPEKVVLRKCQGCQGIFPRDLMIKITKDHISGELFINPPSKITGRSLYICKNPECVKMVLKKKRIERNFRGKELSHSKLLEHLVSTDPNELNTQMALDSALAITYPVKFKSKSCG